MRTLVAAVALIALAAGCGGQSHTASRRQLREGRALFTRSCSDCHTLTGHDTHAAGGDLATATLDVADLTSFVRVMPVRLSSAQVRAIAAYVHAATQWNAKR